MLFTLAMVVFCGSIVAFFSEEIVGVIKRIFELPLAKLLIPLVIVTTIIVFYEPWILFGLIEFKKMIHALAFKISSYISLKESIFIAHILLLFFFSIGPVLLIQVIKKRKSYEPFSYSFITSFIIWLMLAILMTVSFSYPF